MLNLTKSTAETTCLHVLNSLLYVCTLYIFTQPKYRKVIKTREHHLQCY